MSADQQRIGRRGFLGLALGGAVGVGIGAAASSWGEAESPEVAAEPPFHGRHQAGIATPAPAQAALIGFSLQSTVTAADLGRLLRVWTGSMNVPTVRGS